MDAPNSQSNTPAEDVRYEAFLKLYKAHHKLIFRYILTISPNLSAAEDIMQDTMLLMWRKFDQFRPGTNFTSWGIQIAKYNVSNFYQKSTRVNIQFDTDALENLVGHQQKFTENKDGFINALRECARKLDSRNLEILQMKYHQGLKAKEISERIGMTIHAVYKGLARVQYALQKCIQQRLST